MIYLYHFIIKIPPALPLSKFRPMKSEKKRFKYFQALKQNELLLGLEDKDLLLLLDDMEEEILPKHTCSIGNLRTLTTFYFIVSGRLKAYQMEENYAREFTFFLLKKGDVFDILCLLDGCVHEIYYESIDRVVLLSIKMKKMQEWVRKNPGINKNLLPYLGKQMRVIEDYASNVTLIPISARLARLILKYINSESRELELINDLSNEEIANLIGSTRAVVNRHLQQFKQDGIINIGRQKVEIKNLTLLLERANVKYIPPSDPL